MRTVPLLLPVPLVVMRRAAGSAVDPVLQAEVDHVLGLGRDPRYRVAGCRRARRGLQRVGQERPLFRSFVVNREVNREWKHWSCASHCYLQLQVTV